MTSERNDSVREVRVGGDRFAVSVTGTGPPLVLLHGFPLRHSMWASQIEVFSETHTVVAPDLRGHGQSVVTEGTVTMAQMADDVAEILTALEISGPVTLGGLSMGGYVAWEFCRRHADRLSALILCDTRATADTAEVAKGRRMMAAEVVTAGPVLAVDAMLSKLLAPDTQQSQPDLQEKVRQMIMSTSPQGIAATQRGMAERIDMSSHLREIDVPALVICGTEDVITPASEMQRIAAELPQGVFVEIPKAGHLSPLEQPPEVNQAIGPFLRI